MGFISDALDRAFAVPTSIKANNVPGRRPFDDLPTSSSSLVITTDDRYPYLRVEEVVGLQEISLTRQNVEPAIATVVVVWSDPEPDVGSVLLLNGTDASRHLAQVIWAPRMEREQFYLQTGNGTPSEFYLTDQTLHMPMNL